MRYPRIALILAVALLAAPLAAKAQQQAGTIARVGYLTGTPKETQIIGFPTFAAQLRELGHVEGQNLVIEFRHAATQDRLRALTTELVGLGVQVIYATNPYALRAAREVTTTVPIAGYDYETDPVAIGYAASLARPGGNVTRRSTRFCCGALGAPQPEAIEREREDENGNAMEVRRRFPRGG